MTTDLGRTSQDILDIYRRKDVIEKSFDEIKNGLDLKRLRVHSEVAMDGKMFVAFIALILKTFIHNKLKNYIDANGSMSMAQVFDELRMVKVVKVKNGISLLNPLTKKQRTLWEQMGMTEDDLVAALEKYADPRPFFE